eukprot:TRINITY_DN2894_c0_g1_i1.p1 TRINITY_DN2894_c0_g1~~TRINITY_DN2894_c0_g1_i1.p1  ORF type:complete len:123 (+),score=21.78 TRINITY_DN2894_c0_g1_i1:176-544(+)
MSGCDPPAQPAHTCAACALPATMRCSQCKLVWYCTREHQKTHWKLHRKTCGRQDDQADPPQEPAANSSASEASSGKRECRCYFCGESQVFESEEDCVKHLETCSALQQQLSSKEQFTVPDFA